MYWLAAIVYILIICPVVARFAFDRKLYAEALIYSIYVHVVVGLMLGVGWGLLFYPAYDLNIF